MSAPGGLGFRAIVPPPEIERDRHVPFIHRPSLSTGPMDDTRPDTWRHRIGPEQVASVAAAVVLLLGALTVATTMGGSVDAPGQSVASPSAGPNATAHPFAATASLALQLHERLGEERVALDRLLASSEFDAAEVVTTIRRLNGTSRLAADVAQSLIRVPGSRAVGTDLAAFYASIGTLADEALSTSVGDTKAYRAAAERLSATLAPMDELGRRLAALIASARAAPSAVSAPTGSPTPSPTSSPTPSPSASPTTRPPTASPSASRSVSPSASPGPSAPPGQVKNAGFEAAAAAPWVLSVETPAAATLTIDADASAYDGERSARIDITATSDARTAISLRQGDIRIAQGHRYTCRVALRATSDREVRVRVASASGATYGTRVVTVGPSWTLVQFEFGAFVEDPAAILEIDLGRSSPTTWVDGVQISDASVLAP